MYNKTSLALLIGGKQCTNNNDTTLLDTLIAAR